MIALVAASSPNEKDFIVDHGARTQWRRQVAFANAAGALNATQQGAIAGLPTRPMV